MKFFIKFLIIFILTTNSSYAESFFKKLFKSDNQAIPEGQEIDKSEINVVCAITSIGNKTYQNEPYTYFISFNDGELKSTNINYDEMDNFEKDTRVSFNQVLQNHMFVHFERTNGETIRVEWELVRNTGVLISTLKDGNKITREDTFNCKKGDNKF